MLHSGVGVVGVAPTTTTTEGDVTTQGVCATEARKGGLAPSLKSPKSPKARLASEGQKKRATDLRSKLKDMAVINQRLLEVEAELLTEKEEAAMKAARVEVLEVELSEARTLLHRKTFRSLRQQMLRAARELLGDLLLTWHANTVDELEERAAVAIAHFQNTKAKENEAMAESEAEIARLADEINKLKDKIANSHEEEEKLQAQIIIQGLQKEKDVRETAAIKLKIAAQQRAKNEEKRMLKVQAKKKASHDLRVKNIRGARLAALQDGMIVGKKDAAIRKLRRWSQKLVDHRHEYGIGIDWRIHMLHMIAAFKT